MMADVLVSVIIPTYNRERELERALRSVEAQTYRNVEVIVVDDCSAVDPSPIVERFPGARCVRHPHRRGGSAARNTGAAVATGAFLAFLDSDDEWLPRKIELQLERFLSGPPDLGLVYCGELHVYESGRVLTRMPAPMPPLPASLLLHNVVGSASGGMVPGDVFKRHGGFDESLPARQDTDLWYRIASTHSIAPVREPLVRIHFHSGPERISVNGLRKLRARKLFLRKHRAAIVEAGLLARYHYETARVVHLRIGNRSRARAYYARSVSAGPPFLPGVVGLVRTFLPARVETAIARVRRRLLRHATEPVPILRPERDPESSARARAR